MADHEEVYDGSILNMISSQPPPPDLWRENTALESAKMAKNIVEHLLLRATEFEPNSGRIPGFTHNRLWKTLRLKALPSPKKKQSWLVHLISKTVMAAVDMFLTFVLTIFAVSQVVSSEVIQGAVPLNAGIFDKVSLIAILTRIPANTA